MARTAQDFRGLCAASCSAAFLDAGFRATIKNTLEAQKPRDIVWLSNMCAELDAKIEALELALAQAKADRDENEQVIIRLQKENTELRQSLKEAREGYDRFLEATMRAEQRRNLDAAGGGW